MCEGISARIKQSVRIIFMLSTTKTERFNEGEDSIHAFGIWITIFIGYFYRDSRAIPFSYLISSLQIYTKKNKKVRIRDLGEKSQFLWIRRMNNLWDAVNFSDLKLERIKLILRNFFRIPHRHWSLSGFLKFHTDKCWRWSQSSS